MRAPMPPKFKVPQIKSYDGATDADEHVELFRGHMLLQNASDTAMCKAFSLTLTGPARQWFRRLEPASISSFRQLAEVFSAAFSTTKTRRKEYTSLYAVKQGGGSVRDYINRFTRAALEVKHVEDETLKYIFVGGLRDEELTWSLAFEQPSTFSQMLGYAQRHADATEFVKCRRDGASTSGTKRNKNLAIAEKAVAERTKKQKREKPGKPKALAGSFQSYTPLVAAVDEVYAQVRGKSLLVPPPKLKGPRTKRAQGKYCEFHQDVGHTTRDCIQLRDQIERLIREGRLGEFVRRTVNPAPANVGASAQPSEDANDRRRNDSGNAPEPPNIVHTIFGGPVTGDTASSRRTYVREARLVQRGEVINMSEHIRKICRQQDVPITFTEEEADRLIHPHNDAFVCELPVANNIIRRVLVDNGSSADILFKQAFDKLRIDNIVLTPVQTPLYSFTGDCIRAVGKVSLPVTFGEGVARVTRVVDFLVVDKPSQYNAILGRPTLNVLKAIVSTYHLIMKFPTQQGVGVIHSSQRDSRACYENAVRAASMPLDVSTIFSVDEADLPTEGESRMLADLDPRLPEDEVRGTPVEDLAPFSLDPEHPDRTVQLGSQLSADHRIKMEALLTEYKDVFAWSHEDMPGIDPEVISHHLNVQPTYKPVIQKRRAFNPERYAAINEEVQKLLKAGVIREVKYPKWLANVVLVKKSSGKWRVCIDYTDLNKACPKDCFPLPRIDQLVDATAGHELLTFMDAYSGYNQIRMAEEDQEATAFVTDQGLYCYVMMPFGLKNAGATYQRLVNKMFAKLIGRTMEVYVDDMLVKSVRAPDHVADLRASFDILRQYRMKLNPAKCAFGVSSGKFLGYLVNRRGIEVNPAKAKAVIDMHSPRNVKEVQKLTGMIAALSRFVSRATDKCHPFFQALKGRFEWSRECEDAFQDLKRYLATPPLLSKPSPGETLSAYLAVSDKAVSSVLVREENGKQRPVYYTSHAFQGAEERYQPLEKLALAMVTSARKLRPYYQGHTVKIPTKFPLRQVLQCPEVSGRMAKWSVELGQYDVQFVPRTAIKAQALADFIAEFTEANHSTPLAGKSVETGDSAPSCSNPASELEPEWKLYVDGSSCVDGSGAGLLLISPDGQKIPYALRFGFQASNNEAEYEALLAGLRIARELGVERLTVHSDSLLVVQQVAGNFQARSETMTRYLKEAKLLLGQFKSWEFKQIPRSENTEADALARLASGLGGDGLVSIPIEKLSGPSIAGMVLNTTERDMPAWTGPIVKFLTLGELPDDKGEARRIRNSSARYSIINGELYRRGYSVPCLKCIGPGEAHYLMKEIHEGVCGNHSGGRLLAQKCLRQGYYWPTMQQDCKQFAQKCMKCQQFARLPGHHAEPLTSVTSAWPFSKWAIDLIGPLPTARSQLKYCIVAIDYLTKWVEVEPCASMTEAKCTSFVWKNIICRFGIPHTIVTDNAKQFEATGFLRLCDQFGIRKVFSSPSYPQSNGQVEAVNKTIKDNLKKKLENLKGAWIDELPKVLWAYRTTARTATGETPFSLVYGAEAVIPAEVGLPSYRIEHFDEARNAEAISSELDLLEEKRNQAVIRNAARNQVVARYYNRRVQPRSFKEGDLVLKRVTVPQPGLGAFGPKWDGPYKIQGVVRLGTYWLSDIEGNPLTHPWNAELLKKFYC